jgi:hypothetical protein
MPPGLTLSTAGVVTGTPTSPGSFSFTAQVSDSFNPVQQVTRVFTVVVATTVRITTTSLPDPIQNVPYNQQLQAIGTVPLVWSLTSGTLPPGLTLTAAGLLQGTPTTTGSQTFTITATDSRGSTSTQSFTLNVDPPIPTLSIKSLGSTMMPAQLSNVALTLANAYPITLTGQLTLAFTSQADVPSDDPATQFSSGSRTASFSIPAGTTAAVFSSALQLLTGTVTGNVILTANFDNGPTNVPVATVQILPLPPQMTSVSAALTSSGLNVQIEGYAPSRRVTEVEFTFDVKTGSGIQHVSLSRNVDTDFGNWYRSAPSSVFGSTFSFIQSFAVSGSPSAIQGVTVRLTNAQGSTTSTTVKPQ